ncbi:MAG: siroheme synthase, partial [Pseudohongiellaceae bacterium]
CERLQAHGMDREMPAALIQQGTTDRQRLFRGSIQSLPDIIAREEVKAPTLLIIGRVVSLHEQLSWFTPAG